MEQGVKFCLAGQSPPAPGSCCVMLRMLARAGALTQAAEVVACMGRRGVPVTASVAAQTLSALNLQACLGTVGFDTLLQVRLHVGQVLQQLGGEKAELSTAVSMEAICSTNVDIEAHMACLLCIGKSGATGGGGVGGWGRGRGGGGGGEGGGLKTREKCRCLHGRKLN